MQFILILCRGLLLLSKFLEFLSFHMVHQITAGTIFHLLLSVLPLPSIFQLSRACPVLPGTVQLIPLKLVNKFHSLPTTLQCKNRWLIVSATCSQKQHLGHICIPLFIRFSCVSTASFTTNQVKTTTLYGILTFHISFQGRKLTNGILFCFYTILNFFFFVKKSTRSIPSHLTRK